MRRLCALFLTFLLLTGCSREDTYLDKALNLRNEIITAESCTFDAVVTAEYDDLVYQFQTVCIIEDNTMRFTITFPESISGICGSISDSGAEFVFDGTVLAFPMMAEGRISPVSAPWLFHQALVGGYLQGCGKQGEGLLISIDDSYEANALHLNIYTDADTTPALAEIFWQQQKIITIQIQNFSVQ